MIIASDATITDNVIEFFMNFRTDIKYIKNEHKSYEGIKATKYNNEEQLIKKAIENVKNNKPSIFCFDNLKKMITINEILKGQIEDYEKRALLISSEHGPKHVDTSTWNNYDFIMYSPKVIYGNDFTPEREYDVFVLIHDYIIDCLEASQQLSRNRNIGEVYYYINKINHKLQYETYEELKEEYITHYKLHNEVFANMGAIGLNDKGVMAFTENIYVRMYLRYEYYDQVYNSDYEYYFEEILKEKGFIIDEAEEEELEKIKDVDMKKYNEDRFNGWLEGNEKSGAYKENIKKRIELLNIPEEKYETFKETIMDKQELKKHLQISKTLLDNEIILTKKKASKKGDIGNLTSIETKICIMMLFEEKLGIKRFDIDHDKHKNKFKNDIEMDEKIIKLYKKVYRQQTEEKGPIKWGHIYHMLIKMYRQVCGGEIINRKRQKMNKSMIYVYNINKEIIEYHEKLLDYRKMKDDIFMDD